MTKRRNNPGYQAEKDRLAPEEERAREAIRQSIARKVKLLFADTTINTGGLLRCCIATIQEYVEEHQAETPPETLVISCRYEPGRTENIILEKGVWRWNHE